MQPKRERGKKKKKDLLGLAHFKLAYEEPAPAIGSLSTSWWHDTEGRLMLRPRTRDTTLLASELGRLVVLFNGFCPGQPGLVAAIRKIN